MLVAPVPVVLLILLFKLGKIAGFAMVLFCINTIRLIFLTVPCVVVIVLFVVISASGLLIFGSQHSRRHCYWGHKGCTHEGGTPETGHRWFTLLYGDGAIAGPNIRLRPVFYPPTPDPPA
jgi:hypothetical protein